MHRSSSRVALALFLVPPLAAAPPVFTEVTAECGLFGLYDLSQFSAVRFMAAGGATGDFNRDGWADLFVLSGAAAPDRLFINNGDGTFTDRAAEWGLTEPHLGMGAAVGDYDGDGWLDIYVTSFGPVEGEEPGVHRLYRNLAGQSFVESALVAGVSQTSPGVPDGFGAAFGDYDLDGDLDLAVAGWRENSGSNRLFRNDGGTFVDVTPDAILTSLSGVRGFSPRFVDMDGDRYPELLWVADFNTSKYLVNNTDGTFRNETQASGTGKDGNGMGNTIGDYDNDGDLDWVVTSIFDEQFPWLLGNMHYSQSADHQFDEVGRTLGTSDAGWGWGAVSSDFNHDGRLDLAITGGYSGPYWTRPPRLLSNQPDETFIDDAPAAGLSYAGQGRGLIDFDYDNDGDHDLLFLYNNEPMRLYRNDTPRENANWLRVKLANAGRSNIAPDGFGSRVRVVVGESSQLRYIDGGCNYLSQSELVAHFGLAEAAIVDQVVIEWPTGEETLLQQVAANQTLEVSAALLAADATGDGRVNLSDLGLVLAAFGACGGDAAYQPAADLDASGCIDLTDLTDVITYYGTSLL